MYLHAATASEGEGASSSGSAGSLVNVGAIAVGSAFAAFVILGLFIALTIVIVFICIIMRRWVHIWLYYIVCYIYTLRYMWVSNLAAAYTYIRMHILGRFFFVETYLLQLPSWYSNRQRLQQWFGVCVHGFNCIHATNGSMYKLASNVCYIRQIFGWLLIYVEERCILIPCCCF